MDASTFVAVGTSGAVQLAVTASLAAWAAWVGRRHGGGWRHLFWLPVMGLGFAVAGMSLTIWLLMAAFREVALADPSTKAALLADRIADAMVVTAVTAPLSGLCYLLGIVGCAVGSVRPVPPGRHVIAFVLSALALDAAHLTEVATAAGMPVDEVERHLAPLVRDDTVLERMAKPWEAKPWHQYRGLFLTEARIAGGRTFLAAHAETFARAEARYGVPASFVLAILGVETSYGDKMGNDGVATALFTLGFHHPRRGPFFRGELGQFLRLATDQGWPIGEPKGSYAGAMGMGQFMPSSYRRYAVDFDGDGAIDLFRSATDAIGSVANYLSVHGWSKGAPVLVDASVTTDPAALLAGGLELVHTVAELRAAGVTVEGVDTAAKARLFRFEGASGHEYRVGLQNFYVVTRYNRSPLYARAVVELAEAF